MLTEVEYTALKTACNLIVKDSNSYGVFSTACVSSVVGNRNIEFKALYADNTFISTVEDKGYLLVSDNKGTRQNFDGFYNDAFVKPAVSEKLIAYWLIWLTDVSGASACVVAMLASEFVQAGVRLPTHIVKYTEINSTKNGIKKSRTVKDIFTIDTLLQEVYAIVGKAGDENHPANPGILDGIKGWIANSPTRSKKYTSTASHEHDDVILTDVRIENVTADILKEFEL
jgi:hypothetical protein